MHRIYCDSNIFRSADPEHKQFDPEIGRAMEEMKSMLFFCFSDAHLDDLNGSTNPGKTTRDLETIGRICHDHYFSYDHIKTKSIQVHIDTSPRQAFEERRNESIKWSKKSYSLKDIINEFDDEGMPELKQAKELLSTLLNMPLGFPEIDLDSVNRDARSKAFLEKMLPDIRPEMSLTEFTDAWMPYGNTLLHNEKQFRELRQYAHNYLQASDFSFEKWGMDFDQQLKDSVFAKTFLDTVEDLLVNEQKNDPYYRFTMAYSLLELYGIAPERTKNNALKKMTYDNMNRDAAHAFFASYCDYLVTDDKGLQVKAHILYNLYGFRTKILSSKDWLNSKHLIAGNEETLMSLRNSFAFDQRHSFQLYDTQIVAPGNNMKEFKTGHYYFNYFNRIQQYPDANNLYALYCRRETDRNFYFYRELELLVSKLIATLGIDDDARGQYQMSENNALNTDKYIRKWAFNDTAYQLVHGETQSGYFLALTIKQFN